jgi:hypothetical protein
MGAASTVKMDCGGVIQVAVLLDEAINSRTLDNESPIAESIIKPPYTLKRGVTCDLISKDHLDRTEIVFSSMYYLCNAKVMSGEIVFPCMLLTRMSIAL